MEFNLGQLQLNKDIPDHIASKINNKAELQDIFNFDGTILNQMYLKAPNGSIKEIYLNSIIII